MPLSLTLHVDSMQQKKTVRLDAGFFPFPGKQKKLLDLQIFCFPFPNSFKVCQNDFSFSELFGLHYFTDHCLFIYLSAVIN